MERNAIASYGAMTKELIVSPEAIYSGKLKTTLQHEFTHLLGTKITKNKTISGYNMSDSPEKTNKLEKLNKNPINRLIRKFFYKEPNSNVQFNEACVEIFANQYEKTGFKITDTNSKDDRNKFIQELQVESSIENNKSNEEFNVTKPDKTENKER